MMINLIKQNLRFLIILINFGFLLFLLQGCVSPGPNRIAADDNVKLGLAYLQEGNMPIAKEKLLMAADQAPGWAVAKDALGYFFESTGDKKEAEKYYLQAIALSPHDGASLNNYGVFLCRDHRPVEAEKMFLRAAAIPDYLHTAEAYENAGLCALTLPKSDKKADKEMARIYFKKALQQEPQREISARELEKLNE